MSHVPYCDERLAAAPAHTCLCNREHIHPGEHLCLCGHVWHTSWSRLSYDEQRALLGLPEVPHRIAWGYAA